MPCRLNPITNKGYTFKDRTGNRSGRLLFIRFVGLTKHKHSIWEAKCDCGAVTRTSTPNKTKSCGCLQKEIIAGIQRAKRLSPEDKLKSLRRNVVKQRLRRKTDPVLAMHARISRLHRHALSRVGAVKNSATLEALGYSAKEFAEHIEKQFHSGMGWHNMSRWQIDHILPISLAKDADEVIALNQLSNLRPLWANENNAKKAKLAGLF